MSLDADGSGEIVGEPQRGGWAGAGSWCLKMFHGSLTVLRISLVFFGHVLFITITVHYYDEPFFLLNNSLCWSLLGDIHDLPENSVVYLLPFVS